MQPSSACGWWIKPLWWQQNKWGLELWSAHPLQSPLRAAPSHIPVLLKVEVLSQHQLRSSFLQPGLVASCPSVLSYSFCCCNLSHHRDWCESVLWISWVLLIRDVGVGSDTTATPWRLKSSLFPVSKVYICPFLHHRSSFPAQVLLQKNSPSLLFSGFSLTFSLRVFNTLQ